MALPKRSERIIDFSVFLNGTDYLGVATATLPEISYLSDTIKGGGINGELEAPAPGQTGAMTLTLNFRNAEPGAVGLLAPKVHAIDLRASVQEFDAATNEYVETGYKYTIRCRPLTMALGNLEPSASMDANNTFSVTYLKKTVADKEVLEIDKLNYVHKVNGVDYLATTRANLGL